VQALPHRATVATSSTRRTAQLLECRPDLRIVPIRGNVGTRLQKIAELPELDATILAAAGLERLELRISPAGLLLGEGLPDGIAATPLPLSQMLPCPGQAAIGVELRQKDPSLDAVSALLDHPETRLCTDAERAFLQGMGGGCHLAVAAYAEIIGTDLRLRGVSFLAGQPRRGEVRGPLNQAVDLGHALARDLQRDKARTG